jgi:hypothetical protein
MTAQSMNTFLTMWASVHLDLAVKPSLRLACRPFVLDCHCQIRLTILIALSVRIEAVKLSVLHLVSNLHLFRLIVQLVSLSESLRCWSASAGTHRLEIL